MYIIYYIYTYIYIYPLLNHCFVLCFFFSGLFPGVAIGRIHTWKSPCSIFACARWSQITGHRGSTWEEKTEIPYGFPMEIYRFGTFFHHFFMHFPYLELVFLGWVFLILGVKLEHFEAQNLGDLQGCVEGRQCASPARKKNQAWSWRGDRTDIKCRYNNNHKIIIK